jgi:predicted dehydrogenase/threonine dehydrogenase-like Zn-dependent dehydrogenase
MKQVLQDLRTGATEVADVPCPAVGRGQLLIRTRRSLVSAGTERMLVDFGKAGWIDKARQQPDKVRMVIDKIRTDGLLTTVQAVRSKLDQQLPMGYCNVGEVVAVGEGVSGFEIADRVASNGRHAEMVAVPVNLCVRVPAAVSDDDAAFTVLGAIALQGIRLVQPTLGEAIVVTGLGLIGLITVQLLRAQGCRVLGIDFDSARLELARRFGAEVVDLQAGEDPVVAAQRFSRGRGVDATLITAATRSSEPVHQAALMCRKRGRIVLVGVTGLELSRADFYEKELTFQVSCSYGPGRYDAAYEEQGRDYPVGFVRWTEQRNFEAVIDMLAEGRLHVQPLVSHRFAIQEAVKAYEVVAGSEPSLGIVLEYPDASTARTPRAFTQRTVELPASEASQQGSGVAFIGAGNYAGSTLIPAFKAAGVRLRTIVSAGGVSSLHAGRKFGFERATTDPTAALEDAQTDIAVISTRHDTHASLVLAALAAGKHVFTEKPLCLSLDELSRIQAAAAGSPGLLMVGFNRRFAPHVQRMKALLAATPGPKSLIMTVNAGAVPTSHWTQDPDVGGGRLLGEGCHFIDLLRFLVDAPVVAHTQIAMAGASADSATVTLTFADRSVGTLHYLSNGNKAFPKERLQVFAAGRVLELDNFRRLTAFGWADFRSQRLWRQDKGQRACAQAFVDAIRAGGPAPIPLTEIVEVSRLSIEIQQALRGSLAG